MSAQPSTEVATRTPAQELVAQIRGPVFHEQARMVLPENVPTSRFVRATVTALMQNPDLAKAQMETVFTAALKAAQDGLLPDGREAALVVYGGKAVYMAMIGGLRKIAAEHGWSLRTQIVYANDRFEHELGLDTRLVHVPTRLGEDRGDRIAAYAVATHRDGRKEFEVMNAAEIEKVRQVSRSKDSGPWRDWPERMWEKTVGRRLFAKLPLDPGDRRVASVLDASDLAPGAAATALYGQQHAGEITEHSSGPGAATDPGVGPPGREPDDQAATAVTVAADPTPDGNPADSAADEEGAGQQADPEDSHADTSGDPGAAPDDDEPGPAGDGQGQLGFAVPDAVVDAAGQTLVPNGKWQGSTLADVLAAGREGERWLGWALGQSRWDEAFQGALTLFVDHRAPQCKRVPS